MKKLYTLLLLVATAIAPLMTSAETYTAELQSAYQYAYSINITTMPSIDQANMYGTLIRSHMAKMMVNYAKNVLGKTPDTSLSCNFTDIADQSTELRGYIKEACQMGLMGQGITAFNPNATVTRAQFGTVLSRALRGDMFDGADPYYKDHLQSLKDAGIMNKIDIPSANEIRGYVMVMMMRVVEGGTENNTCDSPQTQLYCSLGLDTCPIECQTNTTSAGILSTKKISDSYDVSDGIYLGSLQLTANSSDIILRSIQIQTDTEDVSLRLEQDGVRVSSKVTPNSSDIALLTVSNIRIPSSQSLVLHLVASDLISSLKILSASHISSSATTINGSFPIVL